MAGLFDDLPDASSAGVSPSLTNKVKQFEGFSPRAYGDYKQTSVGYGTRGVPGQTVDEATATEMLNNELAKHAGRIDGASQHFGLSLAPHQREALISFDYNTGAGDRILAQAGGDLSRVPQLMSQFVHVTNPDGSKSVLPGLVNRRNEEASMFLGQPFSAAPSFSQLQPSADEIAVEGMPKSTDISGLFLSPQTPAKKTTAPVTPSTGGMFDDIPEVSQPQVAPQGGVFDDLPEATATPQPGVQAQAPEVGFLEAAGRTAGSALWSVPEYVNRGVGLFPYVEDKVVEAVTGKNPGIYDKWAGQMIDPIVARRQGMDIKPTEQLTTGGKLGAAVGPLARDLPLIVGTGGLAELPAAAGIGARLAHGAMSMAPTAGIAGGDKARDVLERGGSVPEALAKGIGTAGITAASGAVPMAVQSGASSLAGRLISRGVQGAAVAAPVGTVARQAEQLMEGQPVTGMSADDLIAAAPMGVIAAVTGGRTPARSVEAPPARTAFSDLAAAEAAAKAKAETDAAAKAAGEARGEAVAGKIRSDVENGLFDYPDIYEHEVVPELFADLPKAEKPAETTPETPASEVKTPEVSQGNLTGEKGETISLPGGRIEVQTKDTDFSPRKQSVVDFAVDEDKRGQGVGTELVKLAAERNPDLGAQVSSLASLKVFHNEGFRNPNLPEGSFEDHVKAFKENGESLFVARNDEAGTPYVTKAAETPAAEPTLIGYRTVLSGNKRGKRATYDVVEVRRDAEGNEVTGQKLAQGRGQQAADKIRREADRAAGFAKRAPAKNDGGWSEDPLVQLLNGRIMSKTAAKRKGQYENLKGEYDGTKDMLSDPTHNSVFGGSLTPDQATGEAIAAGHLPEGSKPDALWSLLAEKSATAKKLGREQTARQKEENALIKQAEKDRKARDKQLKQEGIEKSESDLSDIPDDVSTDFLSPGDTVTETTVPEIPENIRAAKDRLAALESAGRGDSTQANILRKSIEDAGYGEPKPETPTLENRPEGQLLPESEMPFNLKGEVDSSQTPAEKAASEKAAVEAAANEKAQGDLFSKPKVELTKEERSAKIAERKGLVEQLRELTNNGEKIELTKSEAEKYKALTKQIDALDFGLIRRPDARRIFSKDQRLSTLDVPTIQAAWDAMMGNRHIYDALNEASNGVHYNRDTAIDSILKGENPNISARELYDAYSGVRDLLRAEHGDTIKLFRSEGSQQEKLTKNWATTKEGAEEYVSQSSAAKGKLTEREVPIDDIIAVNVGKSGNYHEVIVGKPPEPTTAQKLDAWADNALKEGRKRLNMGLDPELLAAATWKGARLIQRGITDFAKWSKAMIDEYGNKIRPHLKDLFDRAQNHSQAEAAADAYATGGRAAEFQKTADTLVQKIKSGAGRVSDLAQVAFSQNAARMETLIARVKDPEAKALLQGLADMMHTSPGKDRAVSANTYHEDVSTNLLKFKNELDRAFHSYLEEIKGMSKEEKTDFMSRVGQLLTQESSKGLGGKFGKMLDDIRALQEKLLKYQRDAGIEIGERDNYLKRVLDEEAVAANQDKFLTQATKVYEATLKREYEVTRNKAYAAAEKAADKAGLTGKDRDDFITKRRKSADRTFANSMKKLSENAAASANAYLSRILFRVAGIQGEGKDSLKYETGNGDPKHTKSRELGPEADELLKDFYYRDVQDILATQIHGAVHHAEFSRRFGPNSEKWGELVSKLAERKTSPEIINEVRDIIISQTGGNKNFTSPAARAITDAISLGNLVGFMARSTFSSLSEPIVTAMRSGKMRDIWKSYVESTRETANIIRGKDASDQALLAEDLGIISSAMADQALASRFMLEDSPNNNWSRRLGNNFMRRIGLLQWTEGTKVAANIVAQRHLNRLAEDFSAGRRLNLVRRELRSLGVDDADHASFSKFVKDLTSKGQGVREAIMDETSPEAAIYRRALVRFNRESIMEPSTADRPRPATHPVYRTAFGLMGYLYSFSRNVNSRIGAMARDAIKNPQGYSAGERLSLLKPLAFLPIMVAAQYGLGELRDILWNDPSRKFQQAKSIRSKIWMALSRANILGKYDFPFNLFNVPGAINGVMDKVTGNQTPASEARRYQRDPATALLGPTVGGISEGFQNTVGLFTDKNSDKTNTQERKTIRNYYDVVGKTSLGALLSSPVVPPLVGAAGIQFVNHPMVREAVVGGLAGPAAPPKGLGSALNGRGAGSRGSSVRGTSSRGSGSR